MNLGNWKKLQRKSSKQGIGKKLLCKKEKERNKMEGNKERSN